MLVIEVSQIPAEGREVHQDLAPGEVHLEGEDSFTLEPGGRLDCRLERGEDETVHVRGRLAARLGLDCGRCLEHFSWGIDQDLDLFYLPHQRGEQEEEEDEVELSDHEMVVAYYDSNRLDLGEMLREQLFLALPMKRLCSESCQGLCRVCGANRNLRPCACPEPEGNSRLSGLKTLFDKGSE